MRGVLTGPAAPIAMTNAFAPGLTKWVNIDLPVVGHPDVARRVDLTTRNAFKSITPVAGEMASPA
jgi:hypothetical protein